jgi:opacity protein-like surface antigen
MLSGMKRLVMAASAALLLAGASGAAVAQERAPAPVAAPAVWNGQSDLNLTTKVDWRRDRWRHDRRDWRRDHWRRDWRRDHWHGDWRRDHWRRDWRRDHWRHERWRHHDRWGWY